MADKRIYNVYFDLWTPTGTKYSMLSVDSFTLNDINEIEVNYASESFEGLFDFYFPEFTFSMKGDWLSGVSVNGTVVQIRKFARVKIVREGRQFHGFLSPDGISVTEPAPGLFVTRVTVLSYASALKFVPLGKISPYTDLSNPDETFALYRKQNNQIPFDVNVPDGSDPLDFTEDVTAYIEPDAFHNADLISGDKAEFERVTIFDTRTLSDSISVDTKRNTYPFYKKMPAGQEGLGSFSAYYSWGVRNMPVVSNTEILQHALACVNKYFSMLADEWPMFRLKQDEALPAMVLIRAIPIITGAWHAKVVEFQSRVFAFIWRDQFSVEIFEITNNTLVVSLGTYSYTAPPRSGNLNSLKGDELATEVDGYGRRSVFSHYLPQATWDEIRRDRARNPFRYHSHRHSDGDLYAQVYGTSGNKIYFGWWAYRLQVAEYSQEGYRAESTVFMHTASFDVVTGHLDAEQGPNITNPSNQHYYADRQIARWSTPALDYNGRSFVFTYPTFSDVRMFHPVLTGANTFFIEQKTYEEYFDAIVANGDEFFASERNYTDYSRSSYALVYTGFVAGSGMSLFLENKHVSDLILILTKLTNSKPILSTSDGFVDISLLQRTVTSEGDVRRVDVDYVLQESSISDFRFDTEFLSVTEDEVIIDPELDDMPEMVRKAFSDFYELIYYKIGFTIFQVSVPIFGSRIPEWYDEIQVGNRVQVRGKALTYLGRKERYMDATLIFEEH